MRLGPNHMLIRARLRGGLAGCAEESDAGVAPSRQAVR